MNSKISLKNINNLSRIFIRDNNNYLKLWDYQNKRINKKSAMFVIIVILVFAISYLTYEVMKILVKVNETEIFLNFYLLFLEILVIIQTIMLSSNVFYFSKDNEYILPLPIKPIEILISKFNTIVFILYNTELLIGLIPLVIYGLFINVGILYFVKLLIILIIFPIFPALVISVLMILFMKVAKIFKNKDLMQIVISFILVIMVMLCTFIIFKDIFNNKDINENQVNSILENINLKIKNANKYFLTLNPIFSFLLENNILKIIISFFKLIIINFFGFLIFIFFGKKLYLKQLLKVSFYTKNKIKINIKRKCKKRNRLNCFINKEFNLLIKHPLFFIQCVYPVLLITITFSILLWTLIPKIIELSAIKEYKDIFNGLKFDIEAVCLILGGIQFIGLFNYSSITAFSREGNDAYIIKYLPVSLYKQFIYKNIPQVFLNTIISIIILFIIFYKIIAIPFSYFIPILIISILFNLINSYILCLIDLLMPKLKWDAEYEILKNNKNKLLQYILIIINILFLVYIKKVFIDVDLNLNIIFLIITLFLIFIFILLNIFIKKHEKKLFTKIN